MIQESQRKRCLYYERQDAFLNSFRGLGASQNKIRMSIAKTRMTGNYVIDVIQASWDDHS